MKALVLDGKQIQKYKDVISYYKFTGQDYSEDNYAQNCADRKAESCDKFSYDTNGFDAEITLDSSKLVFFSVPYDKGWSAQVNGEDVEIEKVDYGFMAVLCPAGTSEISFHYETYGIKYGMIITGVGFVSLFAYIMFWHYKKDEKEPAEGDGEDRKDKNNKKKKDSKKDGENSEKNKENNNDKKISDTDSSEKDAE